MAAPTVGDGATPRSGWGEWLRWFALCLVIGATWAAAVPTLGGPDEQAHITKAAAVALGELDGATVRTELGDVTLVHTPEIYSSTPSKQTKRCFAGQGEVPASCASPVEGRAAVVDALTYVGTYPPGYYLLIGLPTRFVASRAGFAWMRAIGVALGAALLASTLASAASGGGRSRLLAGAALAMSPMVWYLIGVVNPNGVEVAGALCAVAAVVALGDAHPTERGRLIRRATIGFVACSLARTPSLGFALLAVGLGWLSLGERRPPWRELPGLRIAAGAAALTAALAVGWALTRSTGGAGEALTHEPVVTSIGETGRFVRQAIGDFGELDTPLPWPLWGAWAAVVSVLIGAAFARGDRSQRMSLGLAVLAATAIPVTFQALAVAPVGANWQGRYGLPALVLVPVLAGASIPRRWPQPGVGAALAVAVVVQVGALFTLLRRYQVGVDGPVWFLAEGTWRAPMELGVLLVASLLAWWTLAVAVARR